MPRHHLLWQEVPEEGLAQAHLKLHPRHGDEVRGVIAARDIKMGEVIFADKPVLKVHRIEYSPVFLQSFKKQIENLSSEAKLQIDKFLAQLPKTCEMEMLEADGHGFEVLGLVATHFKAIDEMAMIFLNTALINHSCKCRC